MGGEACVSLSFPSGCQRGTTALEPLSAVVLCEDKGVC